jgi:hypothetical protein
MTKPSLILGVSAAFVLSLLPLAASAGAAHSEYRPAHWQRAHDGQGVMRVYGGDVYRTPEPYAGGNFRGGLDVQTVDETVEYADEYYETSDRRVLPPAQPCRSVCVEAYAPPPSPPCMTEVRREVRYAAPHVRSHDVIIHDEESREERSEYYRKSSGGEVYHRPHAPHDDCPCRQDHRYDTGYDESHDERYDDRRDHRYDDRHDDRYDGYRQDDRGDVFGRY